jgi:hypothetical protein
MVDPLFQLAALAEKAFDHAGELGQILVDLELGVAMQLFVEFLAENVHWRELGHVPSLFQSSIMTRSVIYRRFRSVDRSGKINYGRYTEGIQGAPQ